MPTYRVRGWIRWQTKPGSDEPIHVEIEMPDGDLYDLTDTTEGAELMGDIWISAGLPNIREKVSD